MTDCVLCNSDGGTLLWHNDTLRVIDACDAAYPAFTRVIWKSHVAEMTDLTVQQQQELMAIVLLVEKTQRDVLRPDKINLAAFGNMVPHLHWHVIARFGWDSHFPAPVWASAQRERDSAQEAVLRERLPVLDAALHELLERSLPSGG